MVPYDITPHETIQIHEMLNMKTLSITKSKLVQGIVFDEDLRALLEKDVQQSIQSVNKMITTITKAQENLEG